MQHSCEYPAEGGHGTKLAGFINASKDCGVTVCGTVASYKAYGNPIHRPATATVPQSASETPATSLFQAGLMCVWSAMTTLRRTANVKRRARTNAAIFIQKAFM